MSILRAHFDGKTFVPDEPVAAAPGTAVEVKILGTASGEEAASLLPKRRPGSGKGELVYMSPDFDAPLEDFKEYL